MATVQEIMIDSIAKAYRAAEQITTNVDRAKAFTDLATACATALGIKPAEETEVAAMPTTTTPAAKTVKRSSKKVVEEQQPKVDEKPATPVPEPAKPVKETGAEKPDVKETKADIKEDQAKEEVSEENFTEEWTLNALEYFKEDIDEIERYQSMFRDDPDSLNKMIFEATQGNCNDINEITPLNIRLILSFIQSLEQQGRKDDENDEEE